MSISIATLADLGKRKNLKTIEIAQVLDIFEFKHEVQKIVCRINAGYTDVPTRGSTPLLFHYFIKVVERILPWIWDARKIEERRLDRAAKRLVGTADVILFHPEYFFSRSVPYMKSRGQLTATIATMAHCGTNARIEREEFAKFNVPATDSETYYQGLLDANPALNDFDYVFAFSEFVRQSYIENGFPADRVMVANTDIDVQKFAAIPRQSDGVFRVIYVSYTSPLKGLHYLLEAWKTLDIPNKQLVIVGAFKPMPSQFSDYYDSLIKGDDSIVLTGRIPYDEAAAWFAKSTVYVCPSLTEGGPKTVLEAMAVGLPVITTENARATVIDSETGFIVPIRDSGAIAEKIQYCFDHSTEAEAMGKRAQEYSLTRPSHGEELYALYCSILKFHTKK